MPQGREIESATLEELFSETTSGSFPVLMDIRHDALVWSSNKDKDIQDLQQKDGHLRLINSNTAVKYNGERYLPANFSYTLPTEDGAKVSQTSITISAVDRRIVELIRSIKSSPIAVIEAFFTKPTETSFAFSRLYHYEFKMKDVTWDDVTAKWTLVFDPVMQVNVPKDLGTKSRNPSILVE